MYCSRCGALIEDDSPTCLNCGAPIDSLKNEANPYFTATQYGDKNFLGPKYGEPGAPCSFFQAIWKVMTTWRFKGRASRSEFWYWALFYFLTVTLPTFVITTRVFSALIYGGGPPRYFYEFVGMLFWAMITFFPTICVTVRRFHDVGMSGLWFLMWPLATTFLGGIRAASATWGMAVEAIGSTCLLVWFTVMLSLPPQEKRLARKQARLQSGKEE